MIHKLGHSFDIQLFAGSDSGAEGISGEKARAFAAGGPDTGDKSVPAAGEHGSAERAERFEALIKGEYRDLYDAHVQNIVKKRLKGSEETVRKYKALAPALELLEKKYGVPAGDAQALSSALQSESTAGKERAQALAQRQYAQWIQQAESARESYPQLDLSQELSNPRFGALIKSGASVEEAYELVHRRELMERAAKAIEENISRRFISAQRPREGGMTSQSSALMKNDVSHMSKSARQDIIRRVQRGERISF